ncbi:MAG: pyridoxamine 5'-phosphate oxidase family protein [Chloroflexi bacterium]|nr:pyridoxamine 5'-phosphate oxidase family protein [Chloroflexota bacterium]
MAEKSQRMTSDDQRDLLEGRHLAVITTIGADGYPQSTPVWYMPGQVLATVPG